jgi:hypothetical protein
MRGVRGADLGPCRVFDRDLGQNLREGIVRDHRLIPWQFDV